VSVGEDQSLDAWGIHWESVRDAPRNPTRARQETIDRLARQLGGPTIMGGDFNVQRWQMYLSVPDGSIETMEAAGYISAIETPTYHAAYPTTQFDWVFTTPDIEVLAVGVAGTTNESDHLLVWADFAIPEPAVAVLLALGFLLRSRRWR